MHRRGWGLGGGVCEIFTELVRVGQCLSSFSLSLFLSLCCSLCLSLCLSFSLLLSLSLSLSLLTSFVCSPLVQSGTAEQHVRFSGLCVFHTCLSRVHTVPLLNGCRSKVKRGNISDVFYSFTERHTLEHQDNRHDARFCVCVCGRTLCECVWGGGLEYYA